VRHAFGAVLARELLLRVRAPGDIIHPLLFLVAVVALFPLALGAAPVLLARMAPGVIWVATLLTALLSLEPLFRADFEDGTLEQYALAPAPLAWLVLAKITAHWLLFAGPLLVMAPLLAVWFGYPIGALPVLWATLLLGTPTLAVIGGIGAALTLGLNRGGGLLALLVLPLYAPIVIFGAGAADAAAQAVPMGSALRLLGALALFAVSLGPLAIAGGLRISLE